MRSVSFCWPYGGSDVYLVGSFNDWNPEPMQNYYGYFETTLELFPARYQYKFVVDGNWFYDICLPTASDGPHVNNVMIVEDKSQVPFSLNNIGDSCCYINTSLQLLLTCSDWVKGITERYMTPNDGPLLHLLQNYLPCVDLQMKNFHKQLEIIFQKSLNDPQDAEYFLVNLWKSLKTEDNGIIDCISYHTFSRQICLSCKSKSQWEETSQNLTLTLCYNKNDTNTQDILDNTYYKDIGICANCHQNTLVLEEGLETGQYLFVNLVATRDGLNFPMPSKYLHIKNRKKEIKIYKLQGIGHHDGGHYIAFVEKGNHWWVCDDHQVHQIDPVHLKGGPLQVYTCV